ncbi:hypothetical protein SUGI_0298860 [Cryptomeria japonica]|nr:hypothetical protein SUGI_0298860 [Cryptomeria japonica]
MRDIFLFYTLISILIAPHLTWAASLFVAGWWEVSSFVITLTPHFHFMVEIIMQYGREAKPPASPHPLLLRCEVRAGRKGVSLFTFLDVPRVPLLLLSSSHGTEKLSSNSPFHALSLWGPRLL